MILLQRQFGVHLFTITSLPRAHSPPAFDDMHTLINKYGSFSPYGLQTSGRCAIGIAVSVSPKLFQKFKSLSASL
jgi:hypothetical protein